MRIIKVARKGFKCLFEKNKSLSIGLSEIHHNLNELIERNVHLLWISSEWDASREYFKLITKSNHKRLKSHDLVSYFTIKDANHTFDILSAQEQALTMIEAWAIGCWDKP